MMTVPTGPEGSWPKQLDTQGQQLRENVELREANARIKRLELEVADLKVENMLLRRRVPEKSSEEKTPV